MTLAVEQLFRSMRGLTRAKAEAYLPHLNAALVEFGIAEPLALAHFLGQMAHESGDLKFWREIWGPTPAQRGYEGRSDLGNTEPGDGRRYLGRGPIQVTGRANYARVAKRLGIDVLAQPELLEQPQHGFRAAAMFWHEHKLSEVAQLDNVRIVTRIINGGLSGLDDRIEKTQRAKRALGLEV